MEMRRRQFLKLAGGFTGGLVGSLGLSEPWLANRATRYGQAIAQSGGRKRALLVGINRYSASAMTENLRGAVTDVELQYQLLVHRFGFHPDNIIRLTDEQEDSALKPTRQNILDWFQNHLITQSQPNDVVVFHYSGHGSKAQLPSLDGRVAPSDNNSTIVPVDFGKIRGAGQIVLDISGRTLFLLQALLPTVHSTMVMDCCYAGGIRKYRARATGNASDSPTITPQEEEIQRRLLEQLGWAGEDLTSKLSGDVEKGLFLYAANRDRPAIDMDFGGFSAGAFTYALTQYLWQRTEAPTVSVAMPPLSASIRRLLRNDESLNSTPEHNPATFTKTKSPSIFHVPFQTQSGEAVITQVLAGDKVALWLGGASAASLPGFNLGAQFVDSKELILATVERRDGLRAIAAISSIDSKPLPALLEGVVLRERSRAIQTNLQIDIALDDALAPEEKKSASTLLAAVEGLNVVPDAAQASVILGRLMAEDVRDLSDSAAIVELNSLGLFYVPRVPIVDSFGLADEPMAEGIHRLQGKFKQLLIYNLLHSLINAETSQVSAAIALEHQPSQSSQWQPVAQIQTSRDNLGAFEDSHRSQLPCVAIRDRMRIQVTNQEAVELYLCAFAINPIGQVDVVFPWGWDSPDAETLIPVNQTLVIPPSPSSSPDDLKMVVTPPVGLNEIILVASKRPLGRALRSFQSIANRKRGTFRLNEPATLFGDLLTDLSGDVRRGSRDISVRQNRRYELATDSLAIVSIPFRAVEDTRCLS